MKDSRQIVAGDAFTYKGGVYNTEDFIKNFIKIEMQARGIEIIQIMQKKGEAHLVEQKTKEQKNIEQSLLEETIVQAADMADMLKEAEKDSKAARAGANRLKYKQIKLAFNSYANANSAKLYIEQQLRIKDITIVSQGTGHTLVAKNVTDKELDAITKYYQMGKLSGALIDAVGNSADKVTSGVDYVAKNLVAPVTEIGARTGASLLATAVGIFGRTGATLFSASVDGFNKAKKDIAEDPATLRAARDLINTKDGIKRSLGKSMGTANGITVEFDEVESDEIV